MYSTSHSTILLNTLLQILKNSVINIKMYTVGGLFSGIGVIELGFEKAGFKVKTNIFRRWDTLPIKKKRLDHEFRNINNNELMISGFSLLITHK